MVNDRSLKTIRELAELPAELDEWFQWPWGSHMALVRRLDDRRYIAVIPFIYTHAIVWGWIDEPMEYADRWCYHVPLVAVAAATVWDGEGEPEGWHRHPRSGRRRENGDPATEEIRL